LTTSGLTTAEPLEALFMFIGAHVDFGFHDCKCAEADCEGFEIGICLERRYLQC
jgi:hypothetical protein